MAGGISETGPAGGNQGDEADVSQSKGDSREPGTRRRFARRAPKVLQEATEVLQKYSQLERTADQIAIYAKYVDSNLDLVSSIDLDDFSTDTVEKVESSARQLESGLEEIVPTRVRLPSRHGIMKMKAEEAVPVTPNPVPPRP